MTQSQQNGQCSLVEKAIEQQRAQSFAKTNEKDSNVKKREEARAWRKGKIDEAKSNGSSDRVTQRRLRMKKQLKLVSEVGAARAHRLSSVHLDKVAVYTSNR